MDGPAHPTNRPTITLGCRGIASFDLTVYGPALPQHSGHYGNYAPNPALRLAQLLSSMKDDGGRVIIPGFYDGIELDEKMMEELSVTIAKNKDGISKLFKGTEAQVILAEEKAEVVDLESRSAS